MSDDEETIEQDTVAPGPNLKLLFQQVVDDGRAFFEAEKDLLKKRLGWRVQLVKTISIFAAVGVVLLLYGFSVLLYVCIAALAPFLGWVGSGALVGGLIVLIAVLCLLKAKRTVSILMESDK